MATLVFHIDDEQEIVVPLVETVTVGSSEGNDVLVEDSSISSRHAEVAVSATGNFVVRDLGSDAGTFVNGRRIKAYPLCEGDEVAFGSLRGRFILDEKDRAAAIERENEERELRRRLEQAHREHEEANAKHRMVLSLLQGLGEEEKKRMDNLDKLQRAINGAESTLAAAEAAAKKFRDEAVQGEKLRLEHAKIEKQIAKITARREAALKEEELQAEKRQTEHAGERARLEGEIATITARRDAFLKEEELHVGKLREEQARVEKEIAKISARRDAAIAEEKQALEAARGLRLKEFEAQKASFQKELNDLIAQQEAARGKLDAMEAERARSVATLVEQQKSMALAEARQQEAKDAIAKCEAELAKAVSERQRALEAQDKERQKLQDLDNEKRQVSEEVAALSKQKSTVSASVATLELSVKDMAQRQTGGILALRERERSMREMLKSIERSKAEQAEVIRASRDLEAGRAKLQESLEDVADQIKSSESRLAELDQAANAKKEQMSVLVDQIKQHEKEHDTIQDRVEALAGTEANLLEARKNLIKAQEEHAAFVALTAERDTRQGEVDALKASLEKLNATRVQVEQTLAAAQASHKDFERNAAAGRERLATEARSLDVEISQKKQQLGALQQEHAAVQQQLQETTARHHDLLEKSRQLAGVEEALRKTKADLTRAQQDKLAIEADTAAAEKESQSSLEKLKSLDAEVAAIMDALASRQEDLVALSNQYQQTAGEHDQLLQKSRELAGVEEELRKVNDDLSRALRQRAELDSTTTSLKQEAHALEATVRQLQSDLKTANAALDGRREEEAAVNKSVAALQAEYAVEAKRLSDLRMAAFEADRKAAANLVEIERRAAAERAEMERKAAAGRAELDAAYEKCRRQVLEQEDQFHSMVSLREEIDALYSQIESSGEENAGAALAAWKAAKKKKEELTELLPKGVGIRARTGRTVLVPRSKES
jgi:chromosome segregation ATPase